jgi:hypothetical protein
MATRDMRSQKKAKSANLSRLTVEELREYRRLEARARGASDVTDTEATKALETPGEQTG